MRRGNVLKLLGLIVVVAALVVVSINPLKNPQTGIPLGLDIRGGVHILLQASPGPGQGAITNQDMDTARDVVARRINGIGVSEPNIQVDYAKKRLYVDMAGIKDPEQAVKLLSTTAQLTFRDPNNINKVVLSGSDVKTAQAAQNTQTGQYVVDVTFTSAGAKKFAQLTTQNVGKQMPIFLDQKEQTSPKIDEPILNGSAEISGSFTSFADAANTANMLGSGALPVSLSIQSKEVIGPSLGADSLLASLNAAKWGIIIVLIFMVLMYRVPGLVADFSLVAYALLVLWVLWSFKAVLTLPGIAGFILSIGMAVDFNIIIYERLKEELRSGKSLRAGIDHAFNRALTTVIDAHVTTSIAAITLIIWGSGTVQGFAVTLLIGIIASLFTAIFFTRYVLRLVAGLKAEQNLKLYGA